MGNCHMKGIYDNFLSYIVTSSIWSCQWLTFGIIYSVFTKFSIAPHLIEKKVTTPSLAAVVRQLQACNFIKKRLRYRCFPLYFSNFFKTLFFSPPDEWFCFLNLLPLILTTLKGIFEDLKGYLKKFQVIFWMTN